MKSFQNTSFAALLIFCISFLFLGSFIIPKSEEDENFQVMIEEIWEDQNEILSILTEENFYQKQKERQAKIIREENQEENEQAFCQLNIQPLIDKKIEPKYNLSPERFLTAFVSRGPNNQIYSLRETIFIAVALNRTLILPPFFKHDRGDPTSNGSNTAVVDFDQRVDIEKLRELIPVILTKDASSVCPNGLEKIFRAQKICLFDENPPRLSATQEEMNLPVNFNTENICNHKTQQDKIVPNREDIDAAFGEGFGKEKNLAIKRVLRMNNKDLIRGLFQKEEDVVCAATGFPYESVQIMNLIKHDDEAGNLAREIIQYTERPKHIQNLVRKFIEKFAEEKEDPHFMAIHWRYDEKDWKDEQCRRKPDFKICKDFEIMRDPEKLSDEIESYLSSLEEKFDFIYIAAPPSELALIEGVGKSFARKGLIPIVSQVEMDRLMREEFEASCGEKFKSLRYEILSMLDSEICTVAPVFYYSIMSSYSMNIQQERFVRFKNGATRFNGDIFGDSRYAQIH